MSNNNTINVKTAESLTSPASRSRSEQVRRPPTTSAEPMQAVETTVLPVKKGLDRRLSLSNPDISGNKTTYPNPVITTPVLIEDNINLQDISIAASLNQNTNLLNEEVQTSPSQIRYNATISQRNLAETLKNISHTSNKPTSRPPPNKNPTTVTQPIFPGKEQAFVVQAVEGTTIVQYIRSVADIVGGKNVLFGSRMSLGRVAFYLSSVKAVDDFMANHGGIIIGDQFLTARRLVTKAERLVISNVCPSIPHTAIEKVLKTSVKIVSPMTFISLGIKDEDLSHVFSFRRQLFVVREENRVLPDSIMVDFNGENYRVFLSFEDLKCFKCRQTGHIARNCTSHKEQEAIPIVDVLAYPSLTREKRKAPPSSTSAETDTVIDTPVDGILNPIPDVNETMPLENNSTTSLDQASAAFQNTDKPNKRKKRSDSITSSSSIDLSFCLPAKTVELLDSTNKTNVLSTTALTQFLIDVKGNDRPLRVAERFTDNIPELIRMLILIKPTLLDDRAIRERVRRLVGSLQKAYDIQVATGEDDNITSITDSLSADSLRSTALE